MGRKISTVLVAGLLALGGCGGGGDGTVAEPPPAAAIPAGADYNATDVMFLQMMVPHHEQGLTIVRLAKDRAGREDVRVLAAAIESTQADEVQTMSGWLRAWNQPATAPVNAHHDHGGMPDTTAGEIAKLGQISGEDFDRRFLNAMIAHQDDAIQLARMESRGGTNPKAKALADSIDRSRGAQIDQMLAFLGQ